MKLEAVRSKCGRGSGAYTLAEMLVTIVVIGIAAALVIPTMGEAGVLRIQAAVRTLVSDLSFAQTDALAYQQRRAVIFDEETNTYTVCEVVVSSGGDITYVPLFLGGGPDGEYVIDFDLDGFDGARLRRPDFEGGPTLHFDELGGPVQDGGSDQAAGVGTVYIDSDLATFRLDVAPFTGQISVEQVDGLPE